MKILFACEKSGVGRRAFAARGHEVWSCDIQPSDDNSPFHIQARLEDMIGSGEEWDLIIGHPPCTYTCVSGIHWNSRRPERQRLTEQAVYFVNMIWMRKCPRICIEQPITILSRDPTLDMPYLDKPHQYIQPYEYGDNASKRTCLWLKGLPLLVPDPSKRVPGRWVMSHGKLVERWDNQTDNGQNKLAPSATRSDERSRTYPGIAEAMANQWSDKPCLSYAHI